MSAIGNYVHYKWSNYLLSGTDRTIPGEKNKNKNTFIDWQSQKDVVKRKAMALAKQAYGKDDKGRQDLEDTLNAMMIKHENASARVQEIQNRVTQTLDEKFGESLQKIDYETGNVTMKGDRSSVIGKAKSARIEELIQRTEKLEQILIQQATKSTVPQTVFNTVDTLKSCYEELIQFITEAQQTNGIQRKHMMKAANANLRFLRSEVNALISEYAAFPAVNLQKGTYFEELIKYAPYAMDDAADDAIGEAIGTTGREAAIYERDNFSKFVTTREDFGRVIATTHTSQGKVDVEIEWQGKKLEISAKNVNLDNYYIHILDGSPLLYMLQDVDSEYVNHFLNIFAAHKGHSSKSASVASYRMGILQDIKLVLMYKAITGDVAGRKTANLFIVNDSRTGAVKVYAIDDLIDKIEKQPIDGIQLNGKTFNTSINLYNKWDSVSAMNRVSKLLADAHSKKVSVSLSTKFLK